MEIGVRNEAVKLFNATWDLIEMESRSREQDAEMLTKAHASRYLWGLVGEPKNFARGEWQISRCYALLNMGEAAMLHGELSHTIAQENELSAMDSAFGYEAVARASAVLGDFEKAKAYVNKAREVAQGLEKDEDKKYLEGELSNISLH